MAITTFEPDKRDPYDPADAAEATVDETLDWDSKELAEMFGTRLVDDIDVDNGTIENALVEDESLERDGGDFTDHAFASLHQGQRSMLAARGGGNVSNKDESVHGPTNQKEKDENSYRQAMMLGTILAGGSSYALAMQRLESQARQLRQITDRVEAAQRELEARLEELERARAEGNLSAEDEAAMVDGILEAQGDLHAETGDMAVVNEEMGQTIDSIALETALNNAGLIDAAATPTDGADGGTAAPADPSQREAVRQEVMAAVEAAGGVEALASDYRNSDLDAIYDGMSEEARAVFDEMASISIEAKQAIHAASNQGIAVDTSELSDGAAGIVSRVTEQFEGGVVPSGITFDDASGVCSAPVTMGTDLRVMEATGQSPLGLPAFRAAPSADAGFGSSDIALTRQRTADIGFDQTRDSVTTAAALSTGDDGLADNNGHTADSFASALYGTSDTGSQPSVDPEFTARLQRDAVQPGSMEDLMRRAMDPTFSAAM